MARVLSGLTLAAAAFALIWFLPWNALLVVAMAVAALAFVEYARLAQAERREGREHLLAELDAPVELIEHPGHVLEIGRVPA